MRKIEIIETNLSIDENNIIRDHQSRIVEADSWDEYCEAYERYKCNCKPVWFKPKNESIGFTIAMNCSISNLKYDNLHLSCDITKQDRKSVV